MMNVIKIITWFYKAKYLWILLFSLLLPSLVFSSTFNVTTTQEFRSALANSAGNGESDTINLAAGTYKTSDDGLGTFTFLDNEDFDLTIEGISADATIVSGDNQNGVLSFNVVGFQILVEIKNLSISEGLDTSSTGGVYSKEHITLQSCIVNNNEGYRGGGLNLQDNASLTIENSVFRSNLAGYSGGAIRIAYGEALIKNTTFISNHANYYGGAIYTNSAVQISGSTFESNSSTWKGGAIWVESEGPLIVKSSVFSGNTSRELAVINTGNTHMSIVNSIFYENISTQTDNSRAIVMLSGSVKYRKEVINSAFVNNSGGIYFIGSSENSVVSNTVFAKNSGFDVRISEQSVPEISNSYIQTISGVAFTENILTSGDLGFVDITGNDFHLMESSVLIDSGKNIETLLNPDPIAGYSFPIIDIESNQRIAGASMDIGPYEFSTTRPTITKFDVEGIRKVDQVLSFVTDATSSTGRTIASYKIDNGSGTFVSASSEFSITYTTSGQRSVRVKVTDDQGEWTIKTLVISIVDLTLDEKIVAATEAGRQEVINSPSTYGLALASEIPVAREAGRQDVISSPSTYDLALASEIPVATEAGRQEVINSPSTYGLALASEIPVAREEQIAACLASPSSCGINIPNADIDGNGTQDALTDGLLILRYSFGLTGDSLISGVVAEDATRTTAEEIEAYLATLMPAL